MSYIWEEDYDIFAKSPIDQRVTWHLKRVIPKDPHASQFEVSMAGVWKVSLAWVTRYGDGKYRVRFTHLTHDPDDKTFRSLKAAKAYALAIVSLET